MARESSREGKRLYAYPFHNKIDMQEAGRPEEVPMQEIVVKTTQNFTREDFDQAKKHLESNKDGDATKGFKYTYSSPYPELKLKHEQSQLQERQKDEKTPPQNKAKSEEKAIRSPVNLNDSSTFASSCTEEKNLSPQSELLRRPPRHLKPIPGLRLKKLPAREDDVSDENASYLISRYR